MTLSIIFDLHRLWLALSILRIFWGLQLAPFLSRSIALAGRRGRHYSRVRLHLRSPRFVFVKQDEQRSRQAPVIRMGVIAVLILTAGLAFSAARFGILRVSPGTTKAMRRQMDAAPGSRITQTGWNAYSRIDAVEGVESKGNLARLYIDSDAWTGIREWDGRIESATDLRDYRARFHFDHAEYRKH
jgi:hypothetical protein